MAAHKQCWGGLLLCLPPIYSRQHLYACLCRWGQTGFGCGGHPEPVLMNSSESCVNILNPLASTSPPVLKFSVARKSACYLVYLSVASSLPWVLPGFHEVRCGTALLLTCRLPTVLESQPSVPPPFHSPFFPFH